MKAAEAECKKVPISAASPHTMSPDPRVARATTAGTGAATAGAGAGAAAAGAEVSAGAGAGAEAAEAATAGAGVAAAGAGVGAGAAGAATAGAGGKLYPNCDASVWLRSCETEVPDPFEGELTGETAFWCEFDGIVMVLQGA